jgi:P27 family predicted phage terminase small subunit
MQTFQENRKMARPRMAETVKANQGAARNGRNAPATAADALATIPPPPKHLPAAASGEWMRLAPIVESLGTISSADLRAFELLCSTLATASDAETAVKKEGMTMPTNGGGVRSHPAVKVMETARAQAARLLEQFGLTPKARNYVSRAPTGAGSEGDRWFTSLLSG